MDGSRDALRTPSEGCPTAVKLALAKRWDVPQKIGGKNQSSTSCPLRLSTKIMLIVFFSSALILFSVPFSFSFFSRLFFYVFFFSRFLFSFFFVRPA